MTYRSIPEPDFAVPAVLLADKSPAFDALREAVEAYEAAVRAIQDARDHADDVRDDGRMTLARHPGLVRDAVAAGTTPPTQPDPALIDALTAQAEAAVAPHFKAAQEAAAAVDAAHLAVADEARPILRAAAVKAHGHAVQALQTARAGHEAQRNLVGALASIDRAVAVQAATGIAHHSAAEVPRVVLDVYDHVERKHNPSALQAPREADAWALLQARVAGFPVEALVEVDPAPAVQRALDNARLAADREAQVRGNRLHGFA
jgi:hypothetical protein